jgi:hypothetical protein
MAEPGMAREKQAARIPFQRSPWGHARFQHLTTRGPIEDDDEDEND